MDDLAARAPLGHLLVRVAKAHRRWVSEALEPHGLHVGQELLLARLCRTAGMRQTDLARDLGVELPTVHRTLTRLESAGFVTRRPDPDDARASLAFLTPAGEAACGLVQDIWAAAELRLTAGLKREDVGQVRALLGMLVQQIEPDEVPHVSGCDRDGRE